MADKPMSIRRQRIAERAKPVTVSLELPSRLWAHLQGLSDALDVDAAALLLHGVQLVVSKGDACVDENRPMRLTLNGEPV